MPLFQQRALGALHGRGRARRTAQQSPYPRLELKDIEGLGHIVVRARFKAQQQIAALAAHGEHKDGNVGKAADLLTDLQTVLLRHHQIQQDQIIVRAAGHADRRIAVVGGVNEVALALQVELDPLDQQLLVIHNQ